MFEFTDLAEFWEAAWTWGFWGEPLEGCAAAIASALGRPLSDREAAAAAEGHRFGRDDRRRYHDDMLNGFDRPAPPAATGLEGSR